MLNVRLLFAAACLTVLASCNQRDITRPDDVAAAPSGSASYTVGQLPLPAYATRGGALAVNDSGWIVGWTDSVGAPYFYRTPALWRPSQAPVWLPYSRPSATGGYAADINNGGDIVGVSDWTVNQAQGRGLVWNRKGRLVVTASNDTIPTSINLSGNVAADRCNGLGTYYCNATRFAHAFTGGTTLACLYGSPYGCRGSHAASINDAGWVVGTHKPVIIGGIKHAMIWSPSGAADELSFHGGSVDSAEARHINNTQTASGYASQYGVVQPIVWYATGDFEFVALGYAGIATSVSDNNRAVGFVNLSAGGKQAFTALTPATFTLLPQLQGSVSSTAEDVNTCGTIVGSAVNAKQQTVPAVWRPVPADACDSFQPPPMVRVASSAAAGARTP